MSITLTTFKAAKPYYTAIGGPQKSRFHKYVFPLSILVLNRGGKLFREEALEDLKTANQYEIISIEGPEQAAELEGLFKKYPQVRFLLLHQNCTTGEKINLGIAEAQSPLVCVLFSDMHLPLNSISSRLLEKIQARGILCALPVLKNKKMETIPSIPVPGFVKKEIKIMPFHPLHDEMRGLYPFDYVGIYNKEKFRFSGGYDPELLSSYWQKADFGFRTALWGEYMEVVASYFIQYRNEITIEDNTPDESYKTFYLKNIALEYRRDRAVLPYSRLPLYFFKAGTSLSRAFKEFKAIRLWIWQHRYRFKTDSKQLVATWQVPA